MSEEINKTKAGEAVPLMFIRLELIPYEDLVIYGINK